MHRFSRNRPTYTTNKAHQYQVVSFSWSNSKWHNYNLQDQHSWQPCRYPHQTPCPCQTPSTSQTHDGLVNQSSFPFTYEGGLVLATYVSNAKMCFISIHPSVLESIPIATRECHNSTPSTEMSLNERMSSFPGVPSRRTQEALAINT